MFKTQGRATCRWLLIGSLTGYALWTSAAPANAEDKPVADADLVTWVTKRARDWQPSAAERRFDDIGWVQDIRTAERLAKEHRRPVFLFTHDGRISVGRC